MADEKAAVLGAGLMGHGIAQVLAAAGHDVSVYEPDADMLASVPERVRSIFELLDQDPAVGGAITLHSDLEEAVAQADIVFEAAPENLELKQDIFERLEAATGPDTILASNTSVLPIGEIGARVKRGERVVGTHFWNPPHLVPLVEVVQAERTSEEVVQRTIALLAAAGKSPVHVKRDIAGFVGNRLQHALWREAIALVEAGVCDGETVDKVVKNGFGMRLPVLGPIETADLVGLELTLDIHRVVLPEINSVPGPSPILERKIAAGELGMSTGRGLRDWTPEQCEEVRERLRTYLVAEARRRLNRAGD